MSTPIPVTEAHRKLACEILFECSPSGQATPAGVKAAGQLIADSEALAINAAFPDSGDDSLYNVRRLRAEVERLREWQAGVIANERLHHAERKDAIARAERAEAELAEQKYLKESAVKRAKELTEELAAANAKLLRNESDGYLCELERTRAELAAERAKVRVLRSALERRHADQAYHCDYVDAALAATEETKP